MLAELAIPFVDASAAALAWCIDAPVEDGLAAITIDLDDASLTLAILGFSHQVALRTPMGTLRETVSCTLTESDGLPDLALRTLPVGRYTFRSSIVRCPDAELARRVDALTSRLDASTTAIVGRFPGSLEAVTALELRPSVDGVSWRTHHVYPQTNEIVETTSTVVTR